MLRSASLPLLVVALSCDGESSEDSAIPSQDEVSNPEGTIVFDYTVWNCMTGDTVADVELCDVLPVTDDDTCGVTDAQGGVRITWTNPPVSGDWATSLEHPDYSGSLRVGHYDESEYDVWRAETDAYGAKDGGFCLMTKEADQSWLETGDVTLEAAKGHVWLILYSDDGDSLYGATVTLEDESGQSVGQVVYGHGMKNSLNPDLTTTSVAGKALIANVEPGDYTLKIEHDSLTCESDGWIFASDVANEFPMPVMADMYTEADAHCYEQ